MDLIGLILCCQVFFIIGKGAQKKCSELTYCVEGEKCNGDNCVSCEDGTFRPDLNHKYTNCLNWSEKPPGPFWIIAKNGTTIRDREWECEPGYEEYQHLPDEKRCHLITTTTTLPAQITPSTTTKIPQSKSKTDYLTKNIQSSNSSEGDLDTLPIIIALVGFLVFSSIVAYLLHKKGFTCSKLPRQRDVRSPSENNQPLLRPVTSTVKIQSENGQPFPSSVTSTINVQSQNGQPPHPLTPRMEPPNSVRSQRVRKLAVFLQNKLSSHQFQELFDLLPSCNSYDPSKQLSYNQDRYGRDGRAFTTTFIEWMEHNPDHDLQIALVPFLREMELNEIVKDIDFQKHCAHIMATVSDTQNSLNEYQRDENGQSHNPEANHPPARAGTEDNFEFKNGTNNNSENTTGTRDNSENRA